MRGEKAGAADVDADGADADADIICTCILHLISSMGVSTKLAVAPAHPPAIANCVAVSFEEEPVYFLIRFWNDVYAKNSIAVSAMVPTMGTGRPCINS